MIPMPITYKTPKQRLAEAKHVNEQRIITQIFNIADEICVQIKDAVIAKFGEEEFEKVSFHVHWSRSLKKVIWSKSIKPDMKYFSVGMMRFIHWNALDIICNLFAADIDLWLTWPTQNEQYIALTTELGLALCDDWHEESY